MDRKELEKRLKAIHDKQPHRAALETLSNADKWLKEKAKPALDALAAQLNEAEGGIHASVRRNITKKELILSVKYPNETEFSYSIELKISRKGVVADIRINHKPVEDIPAKPILDWTQDDIQEVFFSGYNSWQPNE